MGKYLWGLTMEMCIVLVNKLCDTSYLRGEEYEHREMELHRVNKCLELY